MDYVDLFGDKLKESIGDKRYKHSLGVMELAKKLAIVYGTDVERAGLAGLFHDCGKFQDNTYLLNAVKDFGIILDNTIKNNTHLIHGPLGAEIVRRVYNIKDKEILNAIRYHTTGRENMSLLEKIIYIADYTEPNRVFPGVDQIRDLAYKDLNSAVLLSMNNTIKYVIDNGWVIHIDTIKARNYLICGLDK